MANFRGEGRVTTGCLWHACRAVTLGLALVITGVCLTVLGFIADQREWSEQEERARRLDNTTASMHQVSTHFHRTRRIIRLLAGLHNSANYSVFYARRLNKGEMMLTSSPQDPARFRLSHVSFSGPVVLGTGGFLVIVACVMTLEARDNAAKIVPATACLETTASKPIGMLPLYHS